MPTPHTQTAAAIAASILDGVATGRRIVSYRTVRDEAFESPILDGAEKLLPARFMGTPLDLIALACFEHGAPDLTVSVVHVQNADRSDPPLPDAAFGPDGRTKISGLGPEDISAERDRMMRCDWSPLRNVLTDPGTYEAIERRERVEHVQISTRVPEDSRDGVTDLCNALRSAPRDRRAKMLKSLRNVINTR